MKTLYRHLNWNDWHLKHHIDHRSGTSCVAMVMHHLGVHMGNELGGYEATGGGEAIGLANLCEKAMRFPAIDPKIPDGQLSKQLKAWIVTRKAEAIRDRTVAGGKYPHLCRFANHLYEALGSSLRIIAVDRPIEASIRSLQDRSSRHPGQWFAAGDDACDRLQRSLLEHRERFIQEHPEVPVHRINFAKLTEDPETAINELIAFLGITLVFTFSTPESITADGTVFFGNAFAASCKIAAVIVVSNLSLSRQARTRREKLSRTACK